MAEKFVSGPMIRMVLVCFLGALILSPLPVESADASVNRKGTDSMRAQPWAFGRSDGRNDAIWHKGVAGSEINKRRNPTPKNGAVDTSGGINQALSRALPDGLTMEEENRRWKVEPWDNSAHPDEDMVRERRRVLRAHAGLQAGEDMSISVGPELIIKDEQYGESAASSGEPDSALGLGMKFKYDF